jgi:hypothetical protein
MIKVERHRFTLINLDKIYAGGHRNAQVVHFFVARKAMVINAPPAGKRFQLWDWQGAESWWQMIPRIIPGREIQIIRKRVFGPAGTEDRTEIGLNSVSFRVATEHTAFVEALFGEIDGKHTLGAIWSNLALQGISMSEAQFRELIHCLLHQYCVISLDS